MLPTASGALPRAERGICDPTQSVGLAQLAGVGPPILVTARRISAILTQ